MLCFGQNPIVLPLLETSRELIGQDEIDVYALISHMHLQSAKDNLMVAKIVQAFEHNKNRKKDCPFPYAVGNAMLLSTLHR
jgi:hypothetical protein